MLLSAAIWPCKSAGRTFSASICPCMSARRVFCWSSNSAHIDIMKFRRAGSAPPAASAAIPTSAAAAAAEAAVGRYAVSATSIAPTARSWRRNLRLRPARAVGSAGCVMVLPAAPPARAQPPTPGCPIVRSDSCCKFFTCSPQAHWHSAHAGHRPRPLPIHIRPAVVCTMTPCVPSARGMAG